MSAPSPTCAWCGEPLGDPPKRGFGIVGCAACGAATTQPWPSGEVLDEAYRGWYRPLSGRFSGFGDVVLRRTRGLLAHRIDRIAPPGAVLDVGAGDGALLDALAARGRRAVGIERESSRADIRAGGLAGLEGGWAAIVFWHSLEHLPDAAEELERSARLLAPGGVLAIAVPNLASLQARLFGRHWLALDLPRHLVHLPADTLIARLIALGLDIERVSHWRGGQVVFGWLAGIVGLLPGRPSLYDAIRRPEARSRSLTPARRSLALGTAGLATPLATAAAGLEIAARRGGSVYIEARRG